MHDAAATARLAHSKVSWRTPGCCAGPCYRCLFPEAPEPQSCSRCSDAGVLGVVPGIIGSLQVRHSRFCNYIPPCSLQADLSPGIAHKQAVR